MNQKMSQCTALSVVTIAIVLVANIHAGHI